MSPRLLLLLTVCLYACPPTDPGATDPAPLLTILPATPSTADALTLNAEPPQDAGFSWENWVVTWERDGVAAGVEDTTTVPATATLRGEAWSATLTSLQTGDVATAAAVTILNSPPAMSFANLDPVAPRSDEPITVLVGGWTDADDDPESYRFVWLVDGQDIGAPDAQTLIGGSGAAGQDVSVIVTPNDGLEDGQPLTAASVTLLNGAPAAPSVTIQPAAPSVTDDLVCAVTESTDPDDDALTWTISWSVGGLDYPSAVPGAAGPLTTTIADDTVPAADTTANQNWVCAAIANDGEYDSDPGTASVYLAADPVPDFGLEDVNATSSRLGQVVSPRDYLQKVSGWYFGHAT